MLKNTIFSILIESQGRTRSIKVVTDENKQTLTLSDSESEGVKMQFLTGKYSWQNGILTMLIAAKQNIMRTLNGEVHIKINVTFHNSLGIDKTKCHITIATQRQEDAFCEVSLNGNRKYNEIYNVNKKWAHISAINFFFSGIESNLEWKIFGE